MAVALVNSKQGAGNSLTITPPAAGNLLVVFASQSSTTSAPTFTDSASGAYTVGAKSSIYASSASSIFMGYRFATGTETTVSFTAGTGGAAQGICYFEVSGANIPIIIEASNNANNGAFASFSTTAAITTNQNDIILAVAALTASQTPAAWTGSKVMTAVGVASTPIIGGSYIASAPMTAQTFTANWTGSRNHGNLVYAISPVYTPGGTGLLALL